jgi:hypothetical protein
MKNTPAELRTKIEQRILSSIPNNGDNLLSSRFRSRQAHFREELETHLKRMFAAGAKVRVRRRF